MACFTAIDAIRIWESSQRRPPAEKIIAVLAAASPDESTYQLTQLTLGQTNRRLLDLREQIFGSHLSASSTCPNCQARFEFELTTDLLRQLDQDRPINSEFDLTSDRYRLRFRVINLADLNSASATHSVSAARAQLVQRCVVTAAKGKKRLSAEQLPDEVISALAARLSECDPEAELLCKLVCPACGFEFDLPFDLGAFFCAEIDAEAQRLLREVHALACGYGWSEAEILEMAAPRRQFYLDMLDQ